VVNGVLGELGLAEQDTILVFNKVDRLTHGEEQALRERIRALESTPAVFVSAHDDRTLDALRDTLRARVQARLAHVIVHVPSTDGEAIAALYREGEVVTRADEDSRVSLTAWVSPALLSRIASRSGVTVEELA
jgi:50S ribosomal subunit-associated GTPase HflX